MDVIPADEVSPAVWSVKLCSYPLCTGDDKATLMAQVLPVIPGGSSGSPWMPWMKVVFADYGVAMRFTQWLQVQQKDVAPNTSYKFNYPGRGNYMGVKLIRVKGDECKDQPRSQ